MQQSSINHHPNYEEFEITPDFTELYLKQETFSLVAIDKSRAILQLEILQCPNSTRGE